MRVPVLNEYARPAPEYDRRWSLYAEATTRATMKRLELEPAADFIDTAIERFKINWSRGLMTARARRGSPSRSVEEAM